MAVSDDDIKVIVSAAVDYAEASGDDCHHLVDCRLCRAGVRIARNQPDAADPWDVVRLFDARVVTMSNPGGEGPARFTIA